MSQLATERQIKTIEGLCTSLEVEFSESWKLLDRQKASDLIQTLIARANNGDSLKEKDFKTEKYSMGFMSCLKSACELYKGTGRTFKQVLEEIKETY